MTFMWIVFTDFEFIQFSFKIMFVGEIEDIERNRSSAIMATLPSLVCKLPTSIAKQSR